MVVIPTHRGAPERAWRRSDYRYTSRDELVGKQRGLDQHNWLAGTSDLDL